MAVLIAITNFKWTRKVLCHRTDLVHRSLIRFIFPIANSGFTTLFKIECWLTFLLFSFILTPEVIACLVVVAGTAVVVGVGVDGTWISCGACTAAASWVRILCIWYCTGHSIGERFWFVIADKTISNKVIYYVTVSSYRAMSGLTRG